MDILKQVKIEALKKDYTLTKLSKIIGVSRENMYHHIKNKNKTILNKIEKTLDLNNNFFF